MLRAHFILFVRDQSASAEFYKAVLEQDPTLEQGDIVMTRQGPIVFQKAGSQERNFTPISNYREIGSEVRRYLATLPVDGEP